MTLYSTTMYNRNKTLNYYDGQNNDNTVIYIYIFYNRYYGNMVCK